VINLTILQPAIEPNGAKGKLIESHHAAFAPRQT
jgi:hypothetical protein